MKTKTRHLPACIMLLASGLLMAQSPYISRVYEYRPAPGQFINELPTYQAGDTENDIRLKAEEGLADNNRVMISLGSFGGYVIFGFDHMVRNIPDAYDFKILGNAFFATTNPNQSATRPGGSSEPGIVMVSYDANGNGRPDDAWYELAGSQYHDPATIHNYSITYYRPKAGHVAVPVPSASITDSTHIAWRDNQGRTGYIPQNTYHTQSYFPEWIDADSITFSGTCLPNNAVDERGDGSYYVLYCYDYGYADNFPNNDDRSNMKIDWAVDAEGKPVELPGIHFVKIYTGLNQVAGWLGETSTEVMGAEDLHVAAALPVLQTPKMSVIACTSDNRLTLTSDCTRRLTIYTVTGQPVMHVQIEAGTSTIRFSAPSGMYIIRSNDDTIRFVKP